MSDFTVAELVDQALEQGASTLSAVLAHVLPYFDDEADKAVKLATDLVTPLARARQYARPWVLVPSGAWWVEELQLDQSKRRPK